MSRARTAVIDAVAVVVTAAAAIAIALAATPMQQVSAVGQIVRVGVTSPSWSFSGPGELDLFGQQIPTSVRFDGPVRPRLQLSHITLSQQLSEFTGGGSATVRSLTNALVTGWEHYLFWQIVVVTAATIVLLGAYCGWLRRSLRHSAVLIVVGLIVTEAVNAGAIMATAYTATHKLRQVHSLEQLVGNAPQLITTAPADHAGAAARAVVLGDSTAAGLGNRPVLNPSAQDQLCKRSQESYARDLAQLENWQITNLACSGATVVDGVLGPQQVGAHTVPPQIDDAAVRRAGTVIISIGANDVDWSALLAVCATLAPCNNKAIQAFFQQRLALFSGNYLQLLDQLQVLPNHPRVLINLYYNPLPPTASCLESQGVSDTRLAATASALDALNSVLRNGAKAAAFSSAEPDFTGHDLCSPDPWVQALDSPAPVHPNAEGELTIAVTDQQALAALSDS